MHGTRTLAAIVTASWANIERIAAAALSAERLTYNGVLRIAPGRISLGVEVDRRQPVEIQR